MFRAIALMGAAALVTAGLGTNAFGSEDTRSAEGRIHHYVRSNQDGGEAENVYASRATANRLEVCETRERCAGVAFVTAWVDTGTGRAAVINGGGGPSRNTK